MTRQGDLLGSDAGAPKPREEIGVSGDDEVDVSRETYARNLLSSKGLLCMEHPHSRGATKMKCILSRTYRIAPDPI